MTHTLTVTAVQDGDVVFILDPCDHGDDCAVWHECQVEGCAPGDEEDALCDGGYTAHEAVAEHGIGRYSFDLDYYGEGRWDAVGFELVTESGSSES